jgi:transposase-like protein
MANVRKYLSAEVKTKITEEVLGGNKTHAQLASEYGIHPTQLTRWKQNAHQVILDMHSVRGRSQKKKETENAEELKKIIGELVIENNYLKKKLKLVP